MSEKYHNILLRLPADLASWVRESAAARGKKITSCIVEALVDARLRGERETSRPHEALDRFIESLGATPDAKMTALCDVLNAIIRPDSQYASTFGEVIYRARVSKRLTQEALAAKVGSDQAAISRLESNKIVDPSARLIQRLARALDLRADDLIARISLIPESGDADERVST